MTVRQLGAALDSREVAEWQAFFRLEAAAAKRENLARRASQGLGERKTARRLRRGGRR